MTAGGRSTPAFRELLRSTRIARGLSQAALAEAADVTTNYVARMESGERTPSDAVVGKLAEALALDPIDVFFSLGRVAPGLRRMERTRRALHRAAQDIEVAERVAAEEEAAWGEKR